MKKRKVVLHFSAQMEEQLKANDHKTGWTHLNPKWLNHELNRHVKDLFNEILFDDDNPKIIRKCVNIANFAMMIADIHDKQIGDK